MVYCFRLAICTGASSVNILDYNLMRFGVCMIKLRHGRMLILRCILPFKKLNYLQKKSYSLPPPVTTTPSKNSITITETISNTQTKSQPLPEKSQPFVKNSQSLLKKSQTHIPPKNFFNPP